MPERKETGKEEGTRRSGKEELKGCREESQSSRRRTFSCGQDRSSPRKERWDLDFHPNIRLWNRE
jgi:hypothetical protein